ncbi:hypothetical protein [Hymenobacter sp. CRA2]|uniref:hypothetical protein n=1 Tax=Hymenobacter sp. CRA2 TaxID=1955620 RepID=UPI00098F75FD|nr:hypothetical protein [Hymenobacter sp. CRA2]OON70532.1 hypothetical protein B0919_00440 [Hymenobacter sp. CRA2]
MQTEPNYWLVGANWEGADQAAAFYRRGYWEMGYDDEDKPNLAEKRDQMKPNDRIAVKSRLGQGASNIAIRALGIVKEVHQGKVYVDWVLTGMNREVNSAGCFGTLHGPYNMQRQADWLRQVFQL